MSVLPIKENPANMTEGLKNFVALIQRRVAEGNLDAANCALVDLYNDIGFAYVCVEETPEPEFVVPEYNPAEDGDYSSWLVANNID